MANGINSVIRIPSSPGKEFFRMWLNFLRPFHLMSDRQVDVAATMLNLRFELGRVITDEFLLDKVVMSADSRRRIEEECGVTPEHLQMLLTKLKRANFITDGKINPRFVPRFNDGDDSFKLMLYFDFNGKQVSS